MKLVRLALTAAIPFGAAACMGQPGQPQALVNPTTGQPVIDQATGQPVMVQQQQQGCAPAGTVAAGAGLGAALGAGASLLRDAPPGKVIGSTFLGGALGAVLGGAAQAALPPCPPPQGYYPQQGYGVPLHGGGGVAYPQGIATQGCVVGGVYVGEYPVGQCPRPQREERIMRHPRWYPPTNYHQRGPSYPPYMMR